MKVNQMEDHTKEDDAAADTMNPTRHGEEEDEEKNCEEDCRNNEAPLVATATTTATLDDDDIEQASLNNEKGQIVVDANNNQEKKATVTYGPVTVEVDLSKYKFDETNKYQYIEEDDDDDVPVVRWNIRHTTSQPRSCCAKMCGLWILSVIALLLLSIFVGPPALGIGMPFYDRGHLEKRREDSFIATQNEADVLATLGMGNDDAQVCIHTDPTIMYRNGSLEQNPPPSQNCQRATTNVLQIMYVSKDRSSNILTPENLQTIQQIENHILNHPQLSRYCALTESTAGAFTTRDQNTIRFGLALATAAEENNASEPYVSCARINSPLNFMDDLYFDIENNTGTGYYLMPNDIIPQEYDLSQSNIDKVVDFWNSYTVGFYNMARNPLALMLFGPFITVPNLFYSVVSSDFEQGSTEAVGLMSSYPLGLPIDGYESASQLAMDQHAATGRWLWEEFDPYLKQASELFVDGNVDVYFADVQEGMYDTETMALAMRSFRLFPGSLLFVLLYLIYMQDSIFIGLVGVLQILLAFIPGTILYKYVFGTTYFGVLNIIAVYIILGIGVDDIFVFCDQWKHQGTQLAALERKNGTPQRFDVRMQKTYSIASKAMFTTSCTTFISFLSNATSAFPVVAAFGLWSALLILVNFCAIISFFPAVYSVYYTYIYPKWWDHPSLLFRCNKQVVPRYEEELQQHQQRLLSRAQNNGQEQEYNKQDGGGSSNMTSRIAVGGSTIIDNNSHEEDTHHHPTTESSGNHHDKEGSNDTSRLVSFFRDTWAPLVIKLRYVILVLFLGILVAAIIATTHLEPDESAPMILPDDNNYVQQREVLLDHFSRAGNPLAIEVLWVSGINPDDPIDRTGTTETNTSDVGSANFLDCHHFNPSTPAAQVWTLNTCHDLFFGNVTHYHNNNNENDDFGRDGIHGPVSRKMYEDTETETELLYYQSVSCVMQGFRDWLLTEYGCGQLHKHGLQCLNETSLRPNCRYWGYGKDGINSCEPFPVPEEHFNDLFFSMIVTDPSIDPATRETNFDRFSQQIFVGEVEGENNNDNDEEAEEELALQPDFSCRRNSTSEDTDTERVLYALSNSATLIQDFAQNYEDGLDLYHKWEEWSHQMREFAPDEMKGTMQTSTFAWSFYFLNERLLQETFSGIGLALGLSFIILTLVGGNIVMAGISVLTIGMIVLDVFAFTVLIGWSVGIIEAMNYVVVIGMSIDYCVHMSEAYNEAGHHHSSTGSTRQRQRHERVIKMVEEMGVSVLSGALSTLGACFFMFFAPNRFFVKFATFMFVTISLSCIYSLTFFPAILSIVGPLGHFGDFKGWVEHKWALYRHGQVIQYLTTSKFRKIETYSYLEKMKNNNEE